MRRSLLLLVAAGVLAGCAVGPAPTPAPAPVPVDERASRAIEDFVQGQRQLASEATAQGRWVEAIAHWEAVLLMRRDDAIAAAERARLDALVRDTAASARAAAQAARKRGDLRGATRNYLRALAADPWDEASARALRDIERQRSERAADQRTAARRKQDQ